jgi:transcriptional regulator with XRE-family HTH domain
VAGDRAFAQRLRARRIDCGLSKSGLAREVGVTGTCVWNWEEGNTHPRPENRATLARVLRTTWLFLEAGASSPHDGLEKPAAGRNEGDATIPPLSAGAVPRSDGRVSIAEGERELITGLLSKDASFRLIVNGHIGVREIERLIEKLEIDKEILADIN